MLYLLKQDILSFCKTKIYVVFIETRFHLSAITKIYKIFHPFVITKLYVLFIETSYFIFLE